LKILPDKGARATASAVNMKLFVAIVFFVHVVFGSLAVVVTRGDRRPIGFASPVFAGFAFIEGSNWGEKRFLPA
jgi:hypothetical protein